MTEIEPMVMSGFGHSATARVEYVAMVLASGVAFSVLAESALSFLGMGVPLPTPSWGNILYSAQQHIDYAWWLAVFPGIAIFLTVAAFNLIGDRLREVLDPKEG